MDALVKLLERMKELDISTGWSPMLLRIVFFAGIVLSLWLDWKMKA
jgi:hypothetical protein